MKRRRIYTYGGKPARRNLTVADLVALKGNARLCQTCPGTEEEAAACEAAGIDVLNTSDADLPAVRAGAPETFTIADLPMTAHPRDILRAAVRAAEAGADAVYTPRSPGTVEMLAREGLSVQGHLGLVPRRSTQRGGLRIVGKTADEAIELAEDFRRLEDAGAFAAEVECVAVEALAAIGPRSRLVTHSIGAGSGGDVIFMFLVDICGESERPPGMQGRSRTSGRCGRRWRTSAAAPFAPTGARSWREATPTRPPPWRCCRTSPRSCSRRSRHAGSSVREAMENDMTAATWVRACACDDVCEEDLVRWDHGGRTFAIYNAFDGFYCTEGHCTHEDEHLEAGLLTGHVIECPLHQGRFDVRTGKVLSPPPCADLVTYPVKTENGDVFVKV